MHRITHCAFAVKSLYSSTILVIPVSSCEFAGTDLKRLSASPLSLGGQIRNSNIQILDNIKIQIPRVWDAGFGIWRLERGDGRGQGGGDRKTPLLLTPSGQGREDCEEDVSLRLLFRDWEACRAVAVMEEEGSYEIASLRSQRQGVVFARSLSDEAISFCIDLGHRALTQQVRL